jgi:hypothetical protein
MRIVVASLVSLAFVAACGGTQKEHENPLVEGGSDVGPNCCCKTVPDSAEKEIVPNYAMAGRMECSTQHGQCVDNVQCNGSTPSTSPDQPSSDTGVPPPPPIGGSSSGPSVP